METADFAQILRDPDPIEVAEYHASRAEGACDRCGRPTMPEESCREFERRLAAAEGRVVPLRIALGGHRHVMCSPSRAQYLPGQPRSATAPYLANREATIRRVLAEMRADARLVRP